METIKPRNSETLWYTLLSAIGMVTTALLVDDQFKETVGVIGFVVLIVIDKFITAKLRFGTTKPLEPVFKKKTPPPLTPLEEAFKRDAEENDLV